MGRVKMAITTEKVLSFKERMILKDNVFTSDQDYIENCDLGYKILCVVDQHNIPVLNILFETMGKGLT